MTFPSSLRRRTRDLSLVPVVSAPVDVDPSCRYDTRWLCPLAPVGNILAARVEAGERLQRG